MLKEVSVTSSDDVLSHLIETIKQSVDTTEAKSDVIDRAMIETNIYVAESLLNQEALIVHSYFASVCQDIAT